jgi:hypothetical protein
VRFWGNLIGYQAVWFCAVIGAGRDLAWPGVLAAIVFIAWQWSLSSQRGVAVKLLLLAVLLGTVVDGSLAKLGWALYAAPWPSDVAAPVWILALWAAFSQTLTQSLGLLMRNTWLAAVLGAVGGPLSYLGASRGFGAVMLVPPDIRALVWLAAGWGIAMPLLALAARRWSLTAGNDESTLMRAPQ